MYLSKCKGIYNMLRNYRKYVLSALLFITIAIGCTVRIYMCIYHFTNCDDLGVAMSMLIGEGNAWSIRNCIEGFINFRAFGWTYAPLQFILTCFLLTPGQSYFQTIVMGRLPSLIFGIISLFILYKLCVRVWENGEPVRERQARICALLLLATSFENIIYSSQMESYSIGVVAVFVCLFLIVINAEEFKCAYTTLIATLLCFSQYQLFIFVFCFYVVMFFKYLKTRNIWWKIILSGILTVLLNAHNLYIFFKSGMGVRGLNWNAGINGQYLFDIATLDGLLAILQYTFKFFASNIIQCYKYLLLPCKYDTVATVLAIILVVLSMAGLIGLHKGNKIQRDIGYFIDVVLGLYFVLILNGILTLVSA